MLDKKIYTTCNRKRRESGINSTDLKGDRYQNRGIHQSESRRRH